MNKSSIWVCVAAAHVIVLVAVVFQGCGKTTKPLKVDPPPTVMPGVVAPTNPPTTASVRPSVSPAVSRLPEPVAKPVAVKTVTHTVSSGESLETIARKYAVRVSELSGLNKITDPKKLRVGQKLVIPGGGEAVSGESIVKPEAKGVGVAASVAGATTGEGAVHVVKAGESLARIAVRYTTTISAIRKANNLKSDVIRVGQKLVIPGNAKDADAQAEAAAAVKPAPAAAAVPAGKPAAAVIAPSVVTPAAVKPVAASNTVVKATHREPAKETPVKKPAAEAPSPAKAAPTAVRTDLQVMTLHDVQSNEDLSGVAMTYGVKADDIRKLNGLGQEPIRPGQRLKIPVP